VKTTIFSRLFKHSAAGSTPTPSLARRGEFEAALGGYRPSAETLAIMANTPLVTLTAPSATGRNTIINELVKTGRYHFIISDTTRPPRKNKGEWEQNGREYFFRDEQAMLHDITEGRFVEAEIIHNQQVSGINAREIERANREGRIAITDVDIEGGINIARLKPGAITICVLPPTFDSWIARMRGRSDFTAEELHRRLQQATKVFRLALSHNNFVFVINDDFRQAVQTVDDIASKGVHHAENETKAHRVAEMLYHDTVNYLREHAPGVRVT
jgi:guanylate kinase